jgi:hypothetical protein
MNKHITLYPIEDFHPNYDPFDHNYENNIEKNKYTYALYNIYLKKETNFCPVECKDFIKYLNNYLKNDNYENFIMVFESIIHFSKLTHDIYEGAYKNKMIDILKIIILIYISFGLPINFNHASETLLNISIKLNSPEIYYPLIKMGSEINLRQNTIQIALNNSINKKNFEYLVYSGLDTKYITSELSEEYKLIIVKSKILCLFKIFYHKYIFLDCMNMYDVIQTLLQEFM